VVLRHSLWHARYFFLLVRHLNFMTAASSQISAPAQSPKVSIDILLLGRCSSGRMSMSMSMSTCLWRKG